MGPANGAVVNCFNSSKKLKYFKETPCEIHTGLLKNDCGCELPFRLIWFLVSKQTLKKEKYGQTFEKSGS